jgi:hypothetical protein
MGYTITVNQLEFSIQAHHFTDLMDHLIKWHTKMKEETDVLRWIDHDHSLAMLNDGDLLAYLEAWTYKPRIDITTGDICNLEFTGEKIGCEDRLWEQIAPWVTDESFINCTGEDGEMWRWYWRQGRFFVVEAEIHYPDPIELSAHHTPAPHLEAELNAARVAVGWDDPQALTDAVKSFINPPDTNYALNALRGTNATHTG